MFFWLLARRLPLYAYKINITLKHFFKISVNSERYSYIEIVLKISSLLFWMSRFNNFIYTKYDVDS